MFHRWLHNSCPNGLCKIINTDLLHDTRFRIFYQRLVTTQRRREVQSELITQRYKTRRCDTKLQEGFDIGRDCHFLLLSGINFFPLVAKSRNVEPRLRNRTFNLRCNGLTLALRIDGREGRDRRAGCKLEMVDGKWEPTNSRTHRPTGRGGEE